MPYATLTELADGPSWTAEPPATVFLRVSYQLRDALRNGLTVARLISQWDGCFGCYLHRRSKCSACFYCADHECDETCGEAVLAAEGERIDNAHDEYEDRMLFDGWGEQ